MGKNIKPYGAIRELEEFLDPSVLKDDDFQMLQKTVDDINRAERKGKGNSRSALKMVRSGSPLKKANQEISNNTARL